MEIYFTRKLRAVLRYIKWHPQKNTIGNIREKFKDDVSLSLLDILCAERYLIMERPGNESPWLRDMPKTVYGTDRLHLTDKSIKLLEDHFSKVWQWAIPTIISVIALIISILSVIFPGVIKVVLLS